MKYLYLLILALFLFTCGDDESTEECSSPSYLGDFDVLDASFEKAFEVYDSHDRVFYKNAQNDTISYQIINDRIPNSSETLCTYKCKLDSSIMIQGYYGGIKRSLSLSRDWILQIPSTEEVLGTGGINISLQSSLHLADPNLGLTGDFINIFVQPKLDSIELTSAIYYPFDLREYPTPIEELKGFDFSEELVVNGESYSDVYSSLDVSPSSVQIQTNLTDGIISIEDADGVLWTLVGYE